MFQIISGIDESVFQHMKIGFYSYIILMVIEFLVFKKKIADNSKFLFSHFFGYFVSMDNVYDFLFVSCCLPGADASRAGGGGTAGGRAALR